MDELDSKIIQLMMRNARMPVKEIAKQVNLTSPAVSSRIHRMEQEGIVGPANQTGKRDILVPTEDDMM